MRIGQKMRKREDRDGRNSVSPGDGPSARVADFLLGINLIQAWLIQMCSTDQQPLSPGRLLSRDTAEAKA